MFGFLKKKVQEETPDTFIVGGLLFLQPRKPDDMDPIINGLVGQVEKRLVSEIGIYQFFMEEIDAAGQGNDTARMLEKHSGFYPIEYKYALSQPSEMDAENSAQSYLNNDVSPVLIGHFGMDIATECRCDIVAIILNKHRVLIDQIRKKVAIANHNHFVTQGDFSSADKWIPVLDSLQGTS